MKQMMTKEAWKSDLVMSTWNVRTMQEISKEMMEYNVVVDLKVMKIKQWIEKKKDREQERVVFEEAKGHPGL
jgi:hypothetical protein